MSVGMFWRWFIWQCEASSMVVFVGGELSEERVLGRLRKHLGRVHADQVLLMEARKRPAPDMVYYKGKNKRKKNWKEKQYF